MNARRFASPLFSRFKRSLSRPEDLVSIVLLLTKPETFLEWELEAAAERAWGVPFPSERHFATTHGPIAFVPIGLHTLMITSVARPYFDDKSARKIQPALPEHQAFVTVDSMDPKGDQAPRYAVIAKLVPELMNENCIGAYSPVLEGFVPNNASLHSALKNL